MSGIEILLLLSFAASADLDDRALAHRIRKGDHEAFRRFFDRHHPALFRFLERRGVPGPVAEDLIQNAFIAIWERRAQIREDQSLRAFLFQSCYNRALNHFRDTARLTPVSGEAIPLLHSTAEEVEYDLMRESLLKAVAGLPERRRAVFELCFLEELTYREAAEVLGISPKTVENQMSEALRSLRKFMEVYR